MFLQDRKQPDVCEKFFHDVPFEAHFASDLPELQPMSAMPGVDGFTIKVDALYKVCGTRTAFHVIKIHIDIQTTVFIFPLLVGRWRRGISGTCRSFMSSAQSRGPAPESSVR